MIVLFSKKKSPMPILANEAGLVGFGWFALGGSLFATQDG